MHPAAFRTAIVIASILLPPAAGAEPASAGDIRIMERYIGEFRSPTYLFDDGKTEHHFSVRYEWFDRPRTLVKFTILMSIPSQDRVITNAEGFYGYDSVRKELYVYGAFSYGASGWGTICEFDLETGARTVCARTMEPDGSLTYVRDSFEVVDDDTWRNTTRIRKGETGEWVKAHEGIYSRTAE